LRHHLLIEVHHSRSTTDGEDDSDDEEEAREAKAMQLGLTHKYPDADIDRLLESFKSSGSFKNDILNGEFIENDIRLSESIREAIEEIKQVQRPSINKSSELDKRKFLQRYHEIAELLGVSLTVEHLLPAILEIVRPICDLTSL
jgi:hypothetical protein